jgi:ribosomal protein L37E
VAVATKRTETATLNASTRRASQSEGYPPIRRALDVLITVEACDSTSYLVPLLLAVGEESEGVWRKVPTALVCQRCRVRRYASQLRTRRCARCGGELQSYPEMIADDEEDAVRRLNKGGVKCE